MAIFGYTQVFFTLPKAMPDTGTNNNRYSLWHLFLYKKRRTDIVFMQKNKQIFTEITNQNRLAYIDSVKGLGILFVILSHHLLGTPRLIYWIYTFHMPLFFIITGFLSVARKQSANSGDITQVILYIRKKTSTLLYPYFTFSLINLLWYLLFHCLLRFGAEESLSTVLLKTLTTYGYHALWFLPTMFASSIISFWLMVRNRFGLGYLLSLIAVASLLSCYLTSLPLPHTTLWYVLNYCGRILLGVSFIGIGRQLRCLISHLSNNVEWILLILRSLVSFLCTPYLTNVNLSMTRIGHPLIFYVAACCGSMFILLLCKKTCLSNSRLLHFVGKNSLIIMALHMDIPIQIGWIFVGATHLSGVLSPRIASVCAILIESFVLVIAVLIINRYLPVLLTPYSRSKSCTNTK